METAKIKIESEDLSFEKEITHEEAVNIIMELGPKESSPLAIERFCKSLTQKQRLYVRAVFDGWKLNSEVRQFMQNNGAGNLVPRSIAGIRQGLTRKGKKHLGEKIDESKWIAEEGQNKYRIKPKFKKDLRPLLG